MLETNPPAGLNATVTPSLPRYSSGKFKVTGSGMSVVVSVAGAAAVFSTSETGSGAFYSEAVPAAGASFFPNPQKFAAGSHSRITAATNTAYKMISRLNFTLYSFKN